MTYMLLFTAFALSAVAAWYSIVGLMTIFAGAATSIAVMGSVLEVAKLVVASWLYRNWPKTPILLKSYFVGAVLVLMLLTSMGIFGYLSKAHSDQNLVSGDAVAKVAIIDEKIKIEKDTIDEARKALAQLDEQVNQTLSRTASQTSDAGVNRSISIRKAQSKERAELRRTIEESQAAISAYNREKAPLAAELRKVEAEVGPIKYIAQLIYGQEATDQNTLEQAVRWVIILIVVVFDPLAVLMFIAYNQSMYHKGIIKPHNDSFMIHEEQTDQPLEAQEEPETRPEETPQVANHPVQWERDKILTPAKN